jgi:hypothetical protein
MYGIGASAGIQKPIPRFEIRVWATVRYCAAVRPLSRAVRLRTSLRILDEFLRPISLC